MASRGVLVIHRADQDSREPLLGHQEKPECGCGWWDYTHTKEEPARQPVETLAPEYYRYGVLCLPDGQLLFHPEAWADDDWEFLVRLILSYYPGHLASIIWCHS